jgi:hypothetical protein
VVWGRLSRDRNRLPLRPLNFWEVPAGGSGRRRSGQGVGGAIVQARFFVLQDHPLPHARQEGQIALADYVILVADCLDMTIHASRRHLIHDLVCTTLSCIWTRSATSGSWGGKLGLSTGQTAVLANLHIACTGSLQGCYFLPGASPVLSICAPYGNQ